MSRLYHIGSSVGQALVALALVGAAPAPVDPHRLALAAGYKAAFLCSDIFTAGRTEAQATADDLTGIYPEYQPLVGDLPAVIDRKGGTVSVAFDAKLPPRVAVWRPLLGCAQLPVGADPALAADLRIVPLPGAGEPPLDLSREDARPWPLGDARATVRPADPRRLGAVVAAAFDRKTYGASSETTAVIVLTGGRIAAERYRPDFDMHTPQRTWSVAKSLTATLVGQAVLRGEVEVEAPARIPEWSAPGDPRARITLAQLLRMNSGLWTDGPGNRTDEVYLGGATVPQTAAAMPLEALPGSRFRYANNDILLAADALQTARPGEPTTWPLRLLGPLGMTRTTTETDWRGHFVLSSQVWMTARDLARLALLYERGGVAPGGKRLIPADWVKFVTAPAGAQPPGADKGGRGYGAGFWLHGPGDGVPAGTYAMEGNRGQYAVIVPSAGVIVIRRGFDAGGAPFDAMAFTKDVLAALGR